MPPPLTRNKGTFCYNFKLAQKSSKSAGQSLGVPQGCKLEQDGTWLEYVWESPNRKLGP